MRNKLLKAAGGCVVLLLGILVQDPEIVAAGSALVAVPATNKVFDVAIDALFSA